MSAHANALLATLPNLKQTFHSFSVLDRDADWFVDRVGQKITPDWYISGTFGYEIEGYKFVRVEFESASEVEGEFTVDVGFERPAHTHCWLKPEDVRRYVEGLRDQIEALKNEVRDLKKQLEPPKEVGRDSTGM